MVTMRPALRASTLRISCSLAVSGTVCPSARSTSAVAKFTRLAASSNSGFSAA